MTALTATSALGVALHDQQWHYVGRDSRRFRSVMPALGLGLAYDYRIASTGWRLGVELKRDFLAANDQGRDRRFLAGNSLGLTVAF